jgi:hypothetical protein
MLNGFGEADAIERERAAIAAGGVRALHDGADLTRAEEIERLVRRPRTSWGGSTSWSTMPACSTLRRPTNFRRRSGT